MAELVYIPEQTVGANQNVLLNSRISCNRGYVLHREGSGITTLRGIVNNQCGCFARYQITYQANVALPTGATATAPIALGIAIDGEVDGASIGISTPGVVEQYNSVSGATFIDVPKGCCYTISLKNTVASTDPAYVQQPMLVQNANVVITRVA